MRISAKKINDIKHFMLCGGLFHTAARRAYACRHTAHQRRVTTRLHIWWRGYAPMAHTPRKMQNAGRIGLADSPAHAPRIGQSTIAARQANVLLKRDADIAVARMTSFCATLGGRHRSVTSNRLRTRQVMRTIQCILVRICGIARFPRRIVGSRINPA